MKKSFKNFKMSECLIKNTYNLCKNQNRQLMICNNKKVLYNNKLPICNNNLQ